MKEEVGHPRGDREQEGDMLFSTVGGWSRKGKYLGCKYINN